MNDYTRATELVDALAFRCRALNVAHKLTDDDTKRATARNAETYAELVNALNVWRTLTTALVDNAGTSRPIALADAIVAAERLLENR